MHVEVNKATKHNNGQKQCDLGVNMRLCVRLT